MNQELIAQWAKEAWDYDFMPATPQFARIEMFANLVAAWQREIDAQIVLSRCIGYAVDDYDLNTLAAEILTMGMRNKNGN